MTRLHVWFGSQVLVKVGAFSFFVGVVWAELFLKRKLSFPGGMKGVYQHCAEHHLHRYLAEFDFRYSNRVALGVDDAVRSLIALKGAKGKRLTYRPVA